MKNQMGTIKEFAEAAAQKVRERLGGGYSVEVTEVTKNNGVRLTALIIRSGQSNMAPTIYLEKLYQDYTEGAVLDEICGEIVRLFEEDVPCREMDLSYIQDFDNIKDRVFYKLLNAEKNREMLRETPHMLFHDLAAVAYISIFDASVGEGTVSIKNGMLSIWGIDKDTLFAHARENTRKLGERVQQMTQILAEMFASDDFPEEMNRKVMDAVQEGWKKPIYVASNDKRSFGAAVMLDEGFLQDFAGKIRGSFYILPSSVHELIFLPTESLDADDLRSMVRDVNRTQVSPEEVLSDSVYYYNKETGRVEMV